MEFKEVSIDTRGNIFPDKIDKVALIDADTIVFGACESLNITDELLPRELYLDEEWEELMADPTYDKETNTVRYINLEQAYEYAMENINYICDRTGCTDFELHFTKGRKSFRYTLVDEAYKANRLNNETIPPAGLNEIKELFSSRLGDKAMIWTEWEADDIVVAKKRYYPDKYIICAVDKDVLYSLPGHHFNYYSSTIYNIDMKWIDVDDDTAMKHHYIQTLTGDTGDNVIGLYRVGSKTAQKLLRDTKSEEEIWPIIVREYAKQKRDEFDALTNYRLVDMRQLELQDDGTFKVKLWLPKGGLVNG